MKNLNDFNIDDMFNDNISEAVIANAASLIEDYGENIAILHGINKELEDKRILIPIAVRKDNYSPYKYGLIDKAYKIIVKPEFDVIADNVLYNKQLILVGKTVPVVYERSIGSNNGEIHLRERYGVIDTKGKTILEPKFDDIYFSENYNLIIVSNGPTNINQGSGLFDRSGKEILPIGSYHKIYGFYRGLARVIRGGKWGIINSYGKLLLPVIYDNIWNFDGKDYSSIIVEKDGIKSNIPLSDIVNGKYISNKYSNDLPF